MTKLKFSQLDATNCYEGKACVAASAVCKRDDVEIATVLPDVTHTLVSNHHIRQAKSAEAKRQPPCLGALHQKCLDSQVQCGIAFQLYDLQNPPEKARLINSQTLNLRD